MCGLFGAVGKSINPGTIRALALINRERGTDSLGFFDNSGKLVKSGKDPMDALNNRGISKFIDHTGRWFLAGHTRYATRGRVCKRNAHPFHYGNIVGSHNGHVTAPKGYQVDSEYLFDQLDLADGDYQRAFADVQGYWALTWFDGDAFYAQAHKNSLWFGLVGDTLYYSSDRGHLLACVGRVECFELTGGRTLQFTPKGYTELPAFVPAKQTKQTSLWGEHDDKNWFYDEWDKAAMDLGYLDIEDLMFTKGYRDKHDAYEFIESFWTKLTS